MSQRQKITLLIVLNILIFSLVGFLTWQTVAIYKILKEPITVVQTGEKILSQKKPVGAVTYKIITDNPQDPQITEVKVDPFDVGIGEDQTVTVKVKSSGSDITKDYSVKGTAITDNKSADFSLELIEAEKENGSLVTAWQGSWKREDSVDKNFQIKILAQTDKGQNKVTITLK